MLMPESFTKLMRLQAINKNRRNSGRKITYTDYLPCRRFKK